MSEQIIAGRYRLAERLGSGGMGVVWQAYDERLHRKVAVKQVLVPAELTSSQSEEMIRRTMREGRIAARLQHPQLITVFDVVQDGGQPYLIMEYLPSTSLSGLGTLPPEEVARIGAEAAAGLAGAHEAGVVHRDVKPANVLVGEDGTVKITDFGIARVAEDIAGTLTSTFAGTPAYLAPEVAKGNPATYASDVYSLGATLYTAVEGEPPSGKDSNPMAQLYRIASGAITPPTKAGPLTDVLMWLLNPDPEQRPTMVQARDALAGVTYETPIPTAVAPAAAAAPAAAESAAAESTAAMAPSAPPPPDDRTGRRGRAVLFAAVLVVVAVAAALVTSLLNREGTPSTAAPSGETTRTTAPTTTSEEPPASEETTEPTETTETTTTTTTTTTTPPQQPPQQPADPGAAIAAYYAMMPGSRAEGWNRLSPGYQAQGRASYDRWWGRVSSVSASEIATTGPTTVEATVLYAFTDGTRTRERHRYTMLNQNGTWLIDSQAVLSSNPA
ncbi:serine/threonine-protein kinase [Actinophytocola glycyrrhizae]|uniref:non-specific serine/threonine protein kinase n=1 Tax=Actinophytocola glycyrrhizae TaxID=2044873 RepID=A0ABV9S3E1_9PSEU